MMRWWLALLAVSLVACAGAPKRSEPEQLYFALEVRQEGKVVAHPKLLGETGKPLRVERRPPGQENPDYQLRLLPTPRGSGFHVEMDLALPKLKGHSALALLHGEERKVELGRWPGELEVTMLLMRVDSPEFRALMDLVANEKAATPAI